MRMKPRNGTCQISAAAVQRPSQMACCEGLPAHRAVAITCNGCAIHSPASKMRFRDSGRQGSLQVPGRSRLSNAFRVVEKFDDVAGFVLGISLIHGTVTVAEVRSLLETGAGLGKLDRGKAGAPQSSSAGHQAVVAFVGASLRGCGCYGERAWDFVSAKIGLWRCVIFDTLRVPLLPRLRIELRTLGL